MPYKWNPGAKRYQWFNGRTYFVSRATVLEWVDKSLKASGSAVDLLSNLVANGNISPNDWMPLMRQYIKDEYIRQYITAIGGRSNMTQSDWGRIGSMLKEQYKYLSGFQAQIAGGNLTEGQIRARARMYINSAREAFEKGNRDVALKWGADEMYWDIDTSVENCPDCITYNAMGWVKIEINPYDGNYPGSGGTVCLTNCHCGIIYRNSKTGEEFMADL